MPVKFVFAAAAVCATFSGAAPIDEIRVLDNKFNALYNSGQYDAVADLYTKDAILIPPTGDAFIPQSQLAGFFKEAASGSPAITNLHLEPVMVKEDDDGLTR